MNPSNVQQLFNDHIRPLSPEDKLALVEIITQNLSAGGLMGSETAAGSGDGLIASAEDDVLVAPAPQAIAPGVLGLGMAAIELDPAPLPHEFPCWQPIDHRGDLKEWRDRAL